MTVTNTSEVLHVWRVLVVDDDENITRQISQYFNGDALNDKPYRLRTETCNSFTRGVELLEESRFDILILDVRLGRHEDAADHEEFGIRTLEAIQKRRFIPTIFYTGLPGAVQHLETPLVHIVEKTESVTRLLDSVDSVIATRLPLLNRAIVRHVERVQAQYMWNFVAGAWNEINELDDSTALAYLLARRLSLSLTNSGMASFAGEVGPGADIPQSGKMHPVQYYVIPPLPAPAALGGDIHRDTSQPPGYRILLTPSCDLVQSKVEYLLWARCVPLAEFQEYSDWKADPSSAKEKLLQSLVLNNRRMKGTQPDRYFFLPAALGLPDLLVDFQQLSATPGSCPGIATRIASLDNPFAEALLSRFARYLNRLGVPDLDGSVIFNRLRTS